MTRQKKIWASVTCLLVVAALAVGAFLVINKIKGSSRYKELIPATAGVVVSVNVGDLAENSGFNEEKINQIINKIESMGAVRVPAIIKNICKDPKQMGLRLDKDAFFWYDDDAKAGGFAVDMLSLDDFQETLESISRELGIASVRFKEKDGLTYVADGSMDEAVIVDGKYLLCVFSDGRDALRQAKAWIEQNDDARYCKTERFTCLTEASGELKVEFSIGSYMNQREWKQFAADLLQAGAKDLKRDDLGIVLSFGVQPGSISAYAEGYCNNPTLKEKLSEYQQYIKTMDGGLLSVVPENFFAWMGVNFNLKSVFDMDEMKALNAQLTQALSLDLNKVLGGLSGDISAYLTFNPANVNEPFWCVNAQLDNTSNLDEAYREFASNPALASEVCQYVVPTGKSNYILMDNTYDIWGNKDSKVQIGWLSAVQNILTVTNYDEYRTPKKSASNLLTSMKDELCNSIFAIVFNKKGVMDMVNRSANGVLDADAQFALDVVDKFASCYLVVDKDFKLKATLAFDKSDQTLVSLIEDIAMSTLTYFINRDSASYEPDEEFDYDAAFAELEEGDDELIGDDLDEMLSNFE